MKLLTLILLGLFTVLTTADIDCAACAAKFGTCMDLSGSWGLPNCWKICERRACNLDPICADCGFNYCVQHPLDHPIVRDLNDYYQPDVKHCSDCLDVIEACTRNAEDTDPDANANANAEQECRARVTKLDAGCREACVGIADL